MHISRLDWLVEELSLPLLALKKQTLVALVISVAVLNYFVVLSPKLEEWQQSKDEREDLESQLKTLQLVLNSSTQLVKHEELLQQLEAIEQLIALQQSLLVVEEQKADGLVLIHRIATKHELTLQRLRWQKREEKLYFDLLPIEIKLIGTMNNIGLFLAEVANLSMMLTFSQSSWSQYDIDNNTVVFEGLGYGYQAKTDSP